MAATERDIRRRSFAMRSVQADTYAEDPVQSELYPAGLSKCPWTKVSGSFCSFPGLGVANGFSQ